MSEFGYRPSDHFPGFSNSKPSWIEPDTPTPSKQFAAAAVDIAQNTVERFQARCATEEAMKDTEQPPLTHIAEAKPLFKPSVVDGVFDPYVKHFERVAKMEKDNRVLTERIEQLEATIDEMRPLITSALADAERIAATLRAFYYAPLTLSAVQPILALACELNADLVEQRR